MDTNDDGDGAPSCGEWSETESSSAASGASDSDAAGGNTSGEGGCGHLGFPQSNLPIRQCVGLDEQ